MQNPEKFSRSNWIILHAASFMLGFVLAILVISQVNLLIYTPNRVFFATNQSFSLAFVIADYMIAGALFGLAAMGPVWFTSRDSFRLPGTWLGWSAFGGGLSFLFSPFFIVPFILSIVNWLMSVTHWEGLNVFYYINELIPNIVVTRDPQAVVIAVLLGLLTGAFFGLWIGAAQGFAWGLGRREFGRWLLAVVLGCAAASLLMTLIATAILGGLVQWNLRTFLNNYYYRLIVPLDGLLTGLFYALLTAPHVERYAALAAEEDEAEDDEDAGEESPEGDESDGSDAADAADEEAAIHQ